RVYGAARQFDRAEEQVRIALGIQPEDVQANLCFAALLLRHTDAAALAEASRRLELVQCRLNEETTTVQHHDAALIRALYLGLTGAQKKSEQEWRRAQQLGVDPQTDREVRQALLGRTPN